MKIVEAGYEILGNVDGIGFLKAIEKAGRICYKSEDKITDESCVKFVQMLVKLGHEAMVEHAPALSVKFTCDRGVSHEIVRHRLFSFAQESTRYCNYSKGKYGNEITVIKPFFWKEGEEKYVLWEKSCQEAEKTYLSLIKMGATPQEARAVLPNSLKTEIIVTGNVREWRHFFKLRTSNDAHPQIREVAIPLLAELKNLIPVIFDDID
ncbi:MAG: FAD-dependent thymidylate synthase [Defluviitaleaceae bacterium]|nr:FAD-dependent thymidylate synthase [Defluviitaleaceae bacterium]